MFARTRVIVIALAALTAACREDNFEKSNVPMVDAGAGAQPLETGEYALFMGQGAKAPMTTGLRFVKAQDHYRVEIAPNAKTIFAREVLDFGEDPKVQAELNQFFEKIRTAPEIEFLDVAAGLGANPTARSSDAKYTPEQERVLEQAHGFTLSPLHGEYYIRQEPATFSPQSWPASDEHKTPPQWTISIVRMVDDAMYVYSVREAAKLASKALFGTRQNCDSNGKCEDVLVVDKFTTTAEVNRQILLHAVRDFPKAMELQHRLVLSERDGILNAYVLAAGGVAGGLAVLVFAFVSRRQSCPSCGTALPRFRRPANLHQALWGGGTCPGCGKDLDRRARVLARA